MNKRKLHAIMSQTVSLGLITLIIMYGIGCSEDENVNPSTPVDTAADTLEMVLIPAGTFRMGNITDNPSGDSDEKPVHTVTITRPFFMSRTEITQHQYESVTGITPSYFVGENNPVESVTWDKTISFCNTLSKQKGYDTCYSGIGEDVVCDFSANGYRLPTEAEWEYACRAGTETDIYTGNLTPEQAPDAALNRAGWYSENTDNYTSPVGLKEPNSFGLYDMHGNVEEWCWDRQGPGTNNYSNSDSVDPKGPKSGQFRVLRGGSWRSRAGECRSASRRYWGPSYRDGHYGFRIVRTQ